MDRAGDVARRYGLDVLLVLLAVAAALELALNRDAREAPQTTLWFCIPATALVVLGLLLRRRFPFGAPAGFWLFAAAVSFVDGRLITFPAGVYMAGMIAAFLLGNVADAVLATRSMSLMGSLVPRLEGQAPDCDAAWPNARLGGGAWDRHFRVRSARAGRTG